MVGTGLKLVLHDLLKMIIQIRLHTMPTLSHNDVPWRRDTLWCAEPQNASWHQA